VAFAAELIRDGLYAAAAASLADCLHDASASTGGAIVAALHQLCVVAAEHLRLAGEFELAAHHHRVAGEELRPALEGLVASTAAMADASLVEAPVPAVSSAVSGEADAGPRDPSAARGELPAEQPGRGSSASARAATAELEVRMLGPLRVRVGQRWVGPWGSLKARSIFQYLAYYYERPIRRDQLMEVFWPGYIRSSARNNLNVALYNLRRTLSADEAHQYVLYADGCYLLNREVPTWIDRDEFLSLWEAADAHRRAQRLDRARACLVDLVGLYGGPLFEDDTSSEWHLPAQRHLEDVYLQALEQLAELQLSAGSTMAAEETARLAAETDVCRESAHRLLMRCYAAQGQQHLVWRQLQLCTMALRRELGAAPTTETVGLAHELTTAT
jgi:DNA-binding SARP family transcriptional activator